jgi:hypothetical protein
VDRIAVVPSGCRWATRGARRDRGPTQPTNDMLTALILICSTTLVPDLQDCTRDNATALMRVPAEFANPLTCFMHGQAYLAESSIGQELGGDDRVKIVCARSSTIDASVKPAKIR